MAQQTLNNGESGLIIRGKINDNFTELYSRSNWNTSGTTNVTTPTISGNVTFSGNVSQSKTETAIDNARPVINAWTYNVQPSSAPLSAIDFHGVDVLMSSSGNTNSNTRLYVFETRAIHNGTDTIGRIVVNYTRAMNNSSGTVSNMTLNRYRIDNTGLGIISVVYGSIFETPANSGGGSITDLYANRIEDTDLPTGQNWGYYSLHRNNYIKGLALGDTPSGALGTSIMVDMKSTTKAPVLPRMTTTERDALTAVSGMLIYNTTTGKLNVRGASVWEAVTSA